MSKQSTARVQPETQAEESVTDEQVRIASLEQRVGALTAALMQLVGPLQMLKKLNSPPTDAVHKAAKNAEALLQQ